MVATVTAVANYTATIINRHSGSTTTGTKYDVMIMGQRSILKNKNLNN